MTINEIERIRREYAEREKKLLVNDKYSLFNQAHLFATHQRQRTTSKALQKKGITDLSKLSILEIGCGNGGVLTEFLNFGASPHNLYGVDLLSDRLAYAHTRLLASHFANADGQNIPFPSQSFDIVMQYTALSSVLNKEIRRKITQDMIRVLKKNGVILWYDFWLNPTNRQTRGIRRAEIRELFPNCDFEFHKITLAPPIARRIVPLSWGFALVLEGLLVINSHYFVLIFPK
jgi:ubiquinone/menaquinone biosynthesis C-methylase UbiE